MNSILNFVSILSVVSLCIRFYFEGKISLETAGLLMVGCVILLALNSTAWKIIKTIVTLGSFSLLISSYTFNSTDMASLAKPILALLFALFGIYIIIKGFTRNTSSSEEEHFIYNRKTRKLRKK